MPPIIPKKSTVAAKQPTTSDLALGEIAINHADAKLYARHPVSGAVQEIGGGGSVTIDSTVSDLLSFSSGSISADDLGSDKIFFWDDSANKATGLSLGTGLEISGTTLNRTALPIEIGLACSDETTALTIGTSKVTFRMPCAMTLTAVRATLTTAPVGSTLIVDINESGTSILSTKLSIDASEKTSTTAATAAVISDSSLADDAEITIDIDQVGSTTAGAGLKVWLIGTR
jgi:hypothetical protein